jgi:hypothetical protein
VIDWIAKHPEAVVAMVGAVLVHMRALMPPAAEGSAYGLLLKLWDVIAGNYGAAANKPPEVKP